MIFEKGLLLTLFVIPLYVFSKYSKKIDSGRPGESNGPSSVGKNIYQGDEK